MDWIERLFNVSPDNGDGTLEVFLILLAIVVAVALFASRGSRARRWFGRFSASSRFR